VLRRGPCGTVFKNGGLPSGPTWAEKPLGFYFFLCPFTGPRFGVKFFPGGVTSGGGGGDQRGPPTFFFGGGGGQMGRRVGGGGGRRVFFQIKEGGGGRARGVRAQGGASRGAPLFVFPAGAPAKSFQNFGFRPGGRGGKNRDRGPTIFSQGNMGPGPTDLGLGGKRGGKTRSIRGPARADWGFQFFWRSKELFSRGSVAFFFHPSGGGGPKTRLGEKTRGPPPGGLLGVENKTFPKNFFKKNPA